MNRTGIARRVGLLLAAVLALTVALTGPANASGSSHYVECYSYKNYDHAWMTIDAPHWDSRWPYLVQTARATGNRAGGSHAWPNAFMDKAQIVLYRPDGSFYGAWTAVDYVKLDVRYLSGWTLVANFHWNIPNAPDRSCTTPGARL